MNISYTVMQVIYFVSNYTHYTDLNRKTVNEKAINISQPHISFTNPKFNTKLGL